MLAPVENAMPSSVFLLKLRALPFGSNISSAFLLGSVDIPFLRFAAFEMCPNTEKSLAKGSIPKSVPFVK